MITESSQSSDAGDELSVDTTPRAPRVAAPADDHGRVIELELADLAYGGDAVGRFQGRAVFVSGGLPGELVRAELTRERSNYARATLGEVLRPSPDPVEPLYPELGESGGFQWQPLHYAAQLVWKTRITRQLLVRVGRFANPLVRPTIGMPPSVNPWHYRTVAQFAVGPDGAIGFRRASSHEVLDMPECPLVHPALDALYQGVRDWLLEQWGETSGDFVERFTLRIASGGAGLGGRGGRLRRPRAAGGFVTLPARPGGRVGAAGGPPTPGEGPVD